MTGNATMSMPSVGFDAMIGMEYTALSPDAVTARLVVTEQLLQPFGILHGGVLCTLIESAGSVAGATWYGDRGQVVGVANHTDFIRATTLGAALTVQATPIHRGRTSQLWLVEIHDESDRLIARGQLRLANIAGSPVGASPLV